MQVLENVQEAVVSLKMNDVIQLTRNAHEQGVAPAMIIQDALIPGIREVGERFAAGTYFLPELLVAGQSVQQAVDYLEPFVEVNEENPAGRFLIGTVKGDIHDIGKNIVAMLLKCNGWQVEDAGVDVDAAEFCRLVSEGDYDIVGLSALLTMTMPAMEGTAKALEEAGLRNKVKLMIGGAPITREFADRIGADAFGKDAWDAVAKAGELLQAARAWSRR